MKLPACVACGQPLAHTLVDLGQQPLANAYVAAENAAIPDKVYPLHVRVCDQCLLVQVDPVLPREAIFGEDYAYFSSYSESWLAHCRRYVDMAVGRFALTSSSKVVEIASNDGYMLQYVMAAGIPCLGVEPAASVAAAARARGVPTETIFFGAETARRLRAQGHAADLLAAKNVLAHVPDINDFIAGVRSILKLTGVFTVEFPHLLNLIQNVQFDTIYHEHFTYLSILALETLFARHGLRIFDVEELSTHGGSLRVFCCLLDGPHVLSSRVVAVRDKEIAAGLQRRTGYQGFTGRVQKVRSDLRAFLAETRRRGERVVGYGAAAKGNTLFNYCGVTVEDIEFVCDRSPVKQGKLLPGSRIPVKEPAALAAARPDYVLIVPWNLRAEIMEQLAYVRDWGARFVVPVPAIAVI